LRRALDGLGAVGVPKVHKNGEWLAGAQEEVSAQQSLVRHLLRVAEESRERVVLEVGRFGFSRSAQLEFAVGGAPRDRANHRGRHRKK
jgi:hypothetical protein